MTINPYYLSADGLVIGTYASTIEVIRGLRGIGGKRRQPVYAASRDGSVPSGELYAEEKRLPLQITIGPWDEDAASDHPDGPIGHLQENLDALETIFGKSGLIDLRQIVPHRDGDIEIQAWGLVDKAVVVSGDPGRWSMLVELILQWPYWHELPQVTRASATSHSFTTGGTAPIADMVATFAGDGILTYAAGGSILEIAGSSGAVVVDVGRRTVTQGGVPARGLLRLGDGTPAHWMRWPAQTAIAVTSTVGVALAYQNARH